MAMASLSSMHYARSYGNDDANIARAEAQSLTKWLLKIVSIDSQRYFEQLLYNYAILLFNAFIVYFILWLLILVSLNFERTVVVYNGLLCES